MPLCHYSMMRKYVGIWQAIQIYGYLKLYNDDLLFQNTAMADNSCLYNSPQIQYDMMNNIFIQ